MEADPVWGSMLMLRSHYDRTSIGLLHYQVIRLAASLLHAWPVVSEFVFRYDNADF